MTKPLILIVIMVILFTSIGCKRVQSKDEHRKVDIEIENELKSNKKIAVMEHLTKETFLKKVFDFEKNDEWKYEGELPCIIDFYADWCGPCKMVAPVLAELAKEYEGKIHIYKVDTETERELSAAFGIRSIPSFLFCPKDGQPQMAMGALPKSSFLKAINEVLLAQEEKVEN